MKNSTIRKRTADFIETANSWQEYYDIGHQIAETGKLIRRMSMHMADLQKKVDSQAEELKRRQNGSWIPCSERLPKEEGAYLLTAKTVSGIRYVRSGLLYSNGKFGSDSVIAWMPLPEPWKEGEEE